MKTNILVNSGLWLWDDDQLVQPENRVCKIFVSENNDHRDLRYYHPSVIWVGRQTPLHQILEHMCYHGEFENIIVYCESAAADPYQASKYFELEELYEHYKNKWI